MINKITQLISINKSNKNNKNNKSNKKNKKNKNNKYIVINQNININNINNKLLSYLCYYIDNCTLLNHKIRYIDNCTLLNHKIKYIKNEKLFICCKLPDISITNYIKLLLYSGIIDCENINSAILVCIILFNKIKFKEFSINIYSCHRLILIIFMISSKLVEDNHYNNQSWADIGGITLSEINRMELYIISLLNYNLFIKKQEFIAISKFIF